MKWFKIFIAGLSVSGLLTAQLPSPADSQQSASFNGHRVVLDNAGKLMSWVKPQSVAYDRFLHDRWSFVKNNVPLSPGPASRSSYPQYYFYCAFRDSSGVLRPDTWMNDIGEKIPNWFENARLYYAYTGDSSVMKIVSDFVDYTLEHGTSAADFAWPHFPFTTTNAGDTLFRGFTSAKRFRLNEVQVDHAGEMGLTYYRMYQYTGKRKYLAAALDVADVLVKHVRSGNGEKSVLPYRVNLKDGRVTAQYGANWSGCYMLLDNLVRSGSGNVAAFNTARDKIRDFILQYPVKTGYWTDGHSDTDIKSNTYKSNLSASNTALCLFDYPELDPDWKSDIPRLIKWTEDNFISHSAPGEPSAMWGANIVGEQDSFLYKMDYQTARYAAECARWYAVSGDESYKDKAFRSLNWVTYCNDSTGKAFESPVSKGILSWWSDCYGECPRMFYHAFSAVPEWAPEHENHILYSEGILRNVKYGHRQIIYTAVNDDATEYLRVNFRPDIVTVNGKEIGESKLAAPDSYLLRDLGSGDFALTIRHNKYGVVSVSSKTQAVSLRINGASKFQTLDGLGVNINTAWWLNGEYSDAKVTEPAIDLLVDSLGATIFRAVIEEMDWEAVNDNKDPGSFNKAYYDKIFSGTKFKGIWNTLSYLNKKGITDGLVISFMGSPPASPPLSKPDIKKSWMGDTDYTISASKEDEFVESLAALLYYMRHTAGIKFSLVSPMNETDIPANTKSAEHPDGIVEGPNIPDAVQFTRILRKLVLKLDKLGMQDLRLIVPDAAGDRLFGECLAEISKDSLIMSRLARWGVHQYGNSAANYQSIVNKPKNQNKSLWVTEMAGIGNLLRQLKDNANAYIFWDGFDCVYQHGRRNGYGDIPPNDWVYWFGPQEGKPLIEYLNSSASWKPRKQFYQFLQVMKFLKPGAVRIGVEGDDSTLITTAFINRGGDLVITGRNAGRENVVLSAAFASLKHPQNLRMFFTDSLNNLSAGKEIYMSKNGFEAVIPAGSVFTITGEQAGIDVVSRKIKVEPDDWYAGDMHVHRNCGDGTSVLPEKEFTDMMAVNDLSVISVLADMGDGEVKDSRTDLPKVNGRDADESLPGRTVHWDAEWHFDPAGTTFENKALGGHIVLLGMKEAHTIWDESPYRILEYGKSQDAIVGFCHMQYLKDSIPDVLDCCTPIDFPVEAALGNIDFLAEDVWLNDASVNAYYRLLNCGFRTGWAAGTDFPCNNSQPFGSLLTYVQVKDKQFSYRKWIEGIRNGRTVVSTNGHNEFLDLTVNGTSAPGDEIKIIERDNLNVEVTWSSVNEQQGRIELVLNGKVVAALDGKAGPGTPLVFRTNVPVNQSSWLCARRMDNKGHRTHTAPVYLSLGNEPVRASAEDALYFVRWIDSILANIAEGKKWNQYFTHDQDIVRGRYLKARMIYEQIASEAGKKQAILKNN